MGPSKLFSSRVHSGCVWPHSGYVFCFIGGNPDKHGALERCFPVDFYRELTYTVVSSAHTVVVCAHAVVMCVVL